MEVRKMETPLGTMELAADAEGLRCAQFEGSRKLAALAPGKPDDAARKHVDRAGDALAAYFEGRRIDFDDLTLARSGTAFQLGVWKALSAIPFGETRSYGQVAAAIGRPGASRAVGTANNRNPFAIIVPCHRVIGADGSLTGYGGGMDRKRWLLGHEGVLEAALFDEADRRRVV